MLKVGILGVGTIGQILARALDGGAHPGLGKLDADLVAICDADQPKAQRFAATLSKRPPIASMDELIEKSELVVEAASQAALPELVPKAIRAHRHLLIMSVGGLLGHEDWFPAAREAGSRIHVPSGAIAGLDGIKSAGAGRIACARLTSRKPVAALQGSKYIAERGIDLSSFAEETMVFEGTAEEAARTFPTTSNVAASLRLAVPQPTPVRVRVVAVPSGAKNIHEIEVQGEFGKLSVTVENVPSPENPRTSQLAAFSALATLAGMTQSLRIGT